MMPSLTIQLHRAPLCSGEGAPHLEGHLEPSSKFTPQHFNRCNSDVSIVLQLKNYQLQPCVSSFMQWSVTHLTLYVPLFNAWRRESLCMGNLELDY